MSTADYFGDDGLLYCGVCHEPKEAFFEKGTALAGTDRHPRNCRCQREELEQKESEYLERRHRDLTSILRQQCFRDPVMRSWTFANAPVRIERLKQCRQYVDSWERVSEENAGLLFWGDVGTGKSYLAACIANALIDKEVPVRMTNLSDVIDHDFADRRDFIHRLCNVLLLILDDFGMERDTRFGLETVYQVINGRYLSGKPLIVTTNLTLDELKHPNDTDRARIYDRVLAMTTPVKFSGDSLRFGKRKDNQKLLKEIFTEGNEQ